VTQSPGGAESGSPNADPGGQQAVPGRAHPPTEAAPPRPVTEAASPYPDTRTAGHGPATPSGQAGPAADHPVTVGGPAGIVRLGPGVPAAAPPGHAGQAGQTGPAADQVWRTGQLPAQPRRRRRLRRAASGAITAVLLVAAGVVLFLRLHHAPLRVTGVAITGQAATGCSVNVTGRIATNGSAGTVSYQWVFRSQSSAPQPLSQSVTSGQDAVYVTVTVAGQGHGSAAQVVTLQVLGPGSGAASARVAVSC
jgi:hypothetical protein